MKILLTNDDGINAKGLAALRDRIKEIADVIVVAPETEQSAVGHAITLSDPLRVREVERDGEFIGYAVNGTPADCVKIAVRAILKEPPDMVISGINLGANISTNVIYSGTVSAATEGTILGIPSIAVSLATFINPDFTPAASFAKKIALSVYEKGLPEGTLLNVNIPNLPEDKIMGVVFTRQGNSRFREEFDKRTDPRGHIYYWQGGEMLFYDEDRDADSGVIRNDMISVTPIHYDLTDYKFLEELKNWEIK
ncbi:MAG: 5'/3'-nucleotidase SurE [Nitrospinae bacterium]|nr:5'/3'-nucleotidase SurE [Nitrospinota bacterium]MBI3813747.1 5'/3'-nucleotidase SurE [Nitrospinota bacterium]